MAEGARNMEEWITMILKLLPTKNSDKLKEFVSPEILSFLAPTQSLQIWEVTTDEQLLAAIDDRIPKKTEKHSLGNESMARMDQM